ncbi:MAG TPA: FAD-binding oxidoreductase [Segeticoccus sp.]|uniref:FAD-binding oxidoreductase n=1 Tax=Segeticoccus sp. TaxID=2706531 RepID=UPI002D7E2069|nr:FAD-binding oxidoreductase [Segeticoccus sp.]HET8599511.1 FAD-binding oxidoreductase [Segeticoccus sp.]
MADTLERLLDATGGHATDGCERDVVDGIPARWVASPGSEQETAAVLRACAEEDLAVVVRGSGSKLTWGMPPARLDVLLDTSRMDALAEHAVGDFVAVVGAGRRLSTLREDVLGAGQRLTVDPPHDGTVGGTAATAVTGPLRLGVGAVRDLLIGARFVLADGTIAHSGGKVVKNVAGYDVGKLLTGSLGTLAVLTQVAFRLHPLPEAQAWVTVPVSGAADAQTKVQALVHSQSVPAAVELDRPADGEATLAVLLEGVAPGVAQRVRQVLDLLGGQASAHEAAPDWWGNEPFGPGDTHLRVTHEIGRLAQLLNAVVDAEQRAAVPIHLRGSVAVGSVLAGIGADTPPETVAAAVAALRERAHSFGGTVVVRDAAPPVKQAVDVWGPVPALGLMRRVKERFDPESRLAPGRFVGGI